MKPHRDKVLAAYADGVEAVEAIAGRITDWSAPTPCEQWRAVDLAGHLLAIVRYFHDLLDAAEATRPCTGLPSGPALAAMNAHDLLALPPGHGPDRIAAFLRTARHYGHRLAQADWHRTLGEWEGIGPMTVAQHTGLAMGEWHIHAWDLARSAGEEHRPTDPETVAAGRSLLGVSLGKADPWPATLIGSGRRPPAADHQQDWAMEEVVRQEALDSEGAQQLVQAFVDEIAALYPGWTGTSGPSAEPVDFQPPRGRFMVVYRGHQPVACGGLKPLRSGAAEIKRLYVRPDMRRRGLGHRMIRELEGVARAQGYAAVRLDTGAEQPEAVRLFKAAGYREIANYNGNPFASHWFEKSLA